LVADASILKTGQSQADVLKLFGTPHASQTNAQGQEEWYYYEANKHFWQRIPLLGKYMGNERIEALQIIFESGKIIKVRYYVPGS
jgi:outer membrane protein assembly factor BamE (lipoprotein component of BamABCDE complex)